MQRNADGVGDLLQMVSNHGRRHVRDKTQPPAFSRGIVEVEVVARNPVTDFKGRAQRFGNSEESISIVGGEGASKTEVI